MTFSCSPATSSTFPSRPSSSSASCPLRRFSARASLASRAVSASLAELWPRARASSRSTYFGAWRLSDGNQDTASRPDERCGIQVGRAQGQYALLVLEQRGGVFRGLLQNGSVEGVIHFGDGVLGRLVQVAELVHLK